MTAYWSEQGIDFAIDMSIDGTLKGTVFQPEIYTFPDSAGVPAGWTMYDPSNGNYWSVLSASASSGIAKHWMVWKTSRYGSAYTQMQAVYSKIPVSGAQYLITIDVRKSTANTTNRAQRAQMVAFHSPALTGSQTVSLTTETTWQTLSLVMNAAPANTTGFRINLQVHDMMVPGDTSTIGQRAECEWRNLTFTQLGTSDTSPTFNWIPIKCDVQSVNVRNGKERYRERYDTAVMTLRVADPVGDYRYSINQPLNLRPGRLLRLKALYESIEYPMAYMVIDNIDESYEHDGRRVVTFACVDVSTLFGQTLTPAATLASPAYAGDRILRLIQVIGWPYYKLDKGTLPCKTTVTASGSPVWDSMAVSSDSEGGHLYAERDGNITFKDRYWESNNYEVQATFLVTPYGTTEPTYFNTLAKDAGNGFPAGSWQTATLGASSATKSFYESGIRFSATVVPNGYYGMTLVHSATPTIPVTGGETYQIEVDHKRTNANLSSDLVYIWCTAAGQIGSGLININNTVPINEWGSTILNVTAPVNAVHVIIGLRMGNRIASTQSGMTTFRNLKVYNVRSVVVTDEVATAPAAPMVCPTSMDTEWSLARIVNALSMANVGGTARTYADNQSQLDYGIRTYQRHDLVLNADTYLDTRAAQYFYDQNRAVLAIKSLTYRATNQDSSWLFTLNAWMNQLIRVIFHDRELGWGWDYVTRIMAVEHSISQRDWMVTLTLDQQIAFADNTANIPTPFGGWDRVDWDATDWDDI